MYYQTCYDQQKFIKWILELYRLRTVKLESKTVSILTRIIEDGIYNKKDKILLNRLRKNLEESYKLNKT